MSAEYRRDHRNKALEDYQEPKPLTLAQQARKKKPVPKNIKGGG